MKPCVRLIVPFVVLGLSQTVWAQTDPFNELAEADSGNAQVTLTVAGVPATLQQSPISVAENDGGGDSSDNQQLTNASFGLPGLSVLTLSGGENQTADTSTSNTASATAASSLTNASVLGGLVQIQGLQVTASCNDSATGDACQGSTSVGSLVIAGQTIPLGSVAPNTSIPVVGNVPVTVAGVPIQLPVNLTLTLNEQSTGGNGVSDKAINVTGFHLVGTANAGLVSLAVDIALAAPVAETAEDETGTECLEGGPEYLANPDDMGSFYQCVDLALHLHTCPPGLLFNVEQIVCDWPQDVPAR